MKPSREKKKNAARYIIPCIVIAGIALLAPLVVLAIGALSPIRGAYLFLKKIKVVD